MFGPRARGKLFDGSAHFAVLFIHLFSLDCGWTVGRTLGPDLWISFWCVCLKTSLEKLTAFPVSPRVSQRWSRSVPSAGPLDAHSVLRSTRRGARGDRCLWWCSVRFPSSVEHFVLGRVRDRHHLFLLSSCQRAVGETLGTDRIFGSRLLARATERQSGRALSRRSRRSPRSTTVS